MELAIEIDSDDEFDPNDNDGVMVIVDRKSKKNFKKKKPKCGSSDSQCSANQKS